MPSIGNSIAFYIYMIFSLISISQLSDFCMGHIFQVDLPPPLEVKPYMIKHFSIVLVYFNMAYKRPQLNGLSQKKITSKGGK